MPEMAPILSGHILEVAVEIDMNPQSFDQESSIKQALYLYNALPK